MPPVRFVPKISVLEREKTVYALDRVATVVGGHSVWSQGPCGLVVRVPGYRSRGTGSITSTTTFSEK
jgi:hypothetical protein